MIAGPKRLGSFTAFLLKDLRCGCAKPLLQVAGANAMETRYRPPQATWGKRKEQMQTALRTRASNTLPEMQRLYLSPPAQLLEVAISSLRWSAKVAWV
ncbi:MAG: hypothetical protein IPJ49_25035 [Candidatus Obscuribacter sp.]|nr:hypothetical protein [Candidatus Obscuribacter sp.]